MSIQEVSAEQFAQLFHHYSQALESDSGRQTAQLPRSWKQVPELEKNRMVTAVHLALLELDSMGDEREDCKRYFAKPGEAEWGC